MQDWDKNAADLELNVVDVSAGLGYTMAVKDDAEIELVRLSAYITSRAMRGYLTQEIVDAVDDDKKVTHEELAESVESVFESEEVRKKLRIKDDKFDSQYLESCYTPIVQSSSSGYDLRSSAVPSSDRLKAGIIVCPGATKLKRSIMQSPSSTLVTFLSVFKWKGTA